jgi:hypothetical protein
VTAAGGAKVPAVRDVVASVSGEQWWVTALVAVGAALLGSIAGALGSYLASTRQEDRRRQALSEIRRKAKVYTPIRKELLVLKRAIHEGRHLNGGISRELPDVQGWSRAPVLLTWHELTEDGRAKASANASVRAALDHVEHCADEVTEAVNAILPAFIERGDALTARSGFSPQVRHWQPSAYQSIMRVGMRDSDVFKVYGDAPSQVDSPEAERFIAAWEGDEAVQAVVRRLRTAEEAMTAAIDEAVGALDAAMTKIAEKYEREPRD